MLVNCVHCGRTVSDSVSVCVNCHRPLVDESVRCKLCRQDLPKRTAVVREGRYHYHEACLDRFRASDLIRARPSCPECRADLSDYVDTDSLMQMPYPSRLPTACPKCGFRIYYSSEVRIAAFAPCRCIQSCMGAFGLIVTHVIVPRRTVPYTPAIGRMHH
jgi:hypothetical protein